MQNEKARSIVDANQIDALEDIIKKLNQPDLRIDSIKLCYEISLLKPKLLSNYFTQIANCLNFKDEELQALTLLTLSKLVPENQIDIWNCRGQICDVVTSGNERLMEAGLKLFIEMAKSSDEIIKTQASECVLVIIEILPLERIQDSISNIKEADILIKDKINKAINKKINYQ
jgi:hypothetical protein